MDLAYKRFIVLFLTFATAFYLSQYFGHSYWLLWSTFFFSLISTGKTFVKLFLTILITLIISIASSLLVSINPYFIILILFLTVIVQQYQPDYSIHSLIVSLFAIISTSVKPDTYMILLGGGLVLGFQLLNWPFYLLNEQKFTQRKVIKHLRDLNQEIFACFLEPSYKNNLYLYERRIHVQAHALLRSLNALRDIDLVKLFKGNEKKSQTYQLEALYANTLDYGQLRLRVTDQATFELCQKEMKTISLAITQIYNMYPIISNARLDFLHQSIKNFEENYQQVLQVTSANPIDFLLFIGSIKRLHNQLSAL